MRFWLHLQPRISIRKRRRTNMRKFHGRVWRSMTEVEVKRSSKVYDATRPETAPISKRLKKIKDVFNIRVTDKPTEVHILLHDAESLTCKQESNREKPTSCAKTSLVNDECLNMDVNTFSARTTVSRTCTRELIESCCSPTTAPCPSPRVEFDFADLITVRIFRKTKL